MRLLRVLLAGTLVVCASFKVIDAQPPTHEQLEPNGAEMISKGSYALVVSPARYRASGITGFQVDQEGVVFQRDLRSDTAIAAAGIHQFNPKLSGHRAILSPQWRSGLAARDSCGDLLPTT
jgi:hypothetical protein